MLELKTVVDTIFKQVHTLVAPAFKALEERIDAVDEKIAKIPAGPQGAVGPKGEPGDPGRQGLNGDPGPAGERGPVGEKGDVGPEGQAGAHGAKGDTGEPGPAGERGPKGDTGAAGQKGDPGERGEPGPTGERGPDGEKGERGEPGREGAPGALGERGLAGEKGDVGPQGPAGDPGPAGQKGEPGLRGERGEKGDPGERGEKGDGGAAGSPGERGEAGPRGEKGERGDDGRDAAALEILPAIAVGRAYARKTYASHNGGLWCSMRKTDPLPDQPTADQVQAAGWSNIVEGNAAIEVEKRGDREIVVRHINCTGRVTETVMKFPVMIYGGTYDESKQDYEVGDTRTWGGSIWHCNVANTKRKPGEIGSDDWTLAVKRGHNGKDAFHPTGAAGPVKLQK